MEILCINKVIVSLSYRIVPHNGIYMEAIGPKKAAFFWLSQAYEMVRILYAAG